MKTWGDHCKSGLRMGRISKNGAFLCDYFMAEAGLEVFGGFKKDERAIEGLEGMDEFGWAINP